MKFFKHELSDVQSTNIGKNTKIWQFVVVLPDAHIGNNCNINANVFIENDVFIGDNVTIKCGVQIWDGVSIENDVFIGPNVTFTNDLIPISKHYPEKFEKTIVKKGASIGANATIIAGNEIGEYSLIGAGAVITKPIGQNEVWVGNPAIKIGYLSNDKELVNLKFIGKTSGDKYHFLNNKLIKK